MFAYELGVKKIKNEYFLYSEFGAISVAQGKHLVKSDSEEFIKFIKDDFDRCGEITIKKNNSISFNNQFCAYAIFSDQINLIENPKRLEYQNDLACLFIKYDLCFIRTGIGPPYELEQEVRQRPLFEKITKIVGKDNFEKMSKYAWGQYYNGMTEGEDPGPGTFISDQGYKSLGITNKIQNIFSKLSNEQKGAIHGLYSMLGRESILLPILLISGQISISEYSNAIIGLGNNYPFIYMDSKNKKEENKRYQELYDRTYAQASLALNYSKHHKPSEEEELLTKDESINHEYKSSLRMNLITKKPDEKMVTEALKEIVAFLNTKGGYLIIGIEDNKNQLGLSVDNFKNIDEWQRYLKDKIINQIGDGYLETFIHPVIYKSKKNKEIGIIKCDKLPDDKQAFLNEVFYIRQTASVKALSNKEMLTYIKNKSLK